MPRCIDYDKISKDITELIESKNGYFINLDALMDDNFDSLLKPKGGKPHYVPGKNETKRYASRDYSVEDKEFIELRRFFSGRCRKKGKADRLSPGIQILSRNTGAKDRMDNFLKRHRLKLPDDELGGLKRRYRT